MKSMTPYEYVVGNTPDFSGVHGMRLLSSVFVEPPRNVESSGVGGGVMQCHGIWAAPVKMSVWA